MATMSRYCKAYALNDLRKYAKWGETLSPAHGKTEEDGYVYVHDSYVVTEGIFVDEGIVFADITEEWKEYCRNVLGFDGPSYRTEEKAGDDKTEIS